MKKRVTAKALERPPRNAPLLVLWAWRDAMYRAAVSRRKIVGRDRRYSSVPSPPGTPREIRMPSTMDLHKLFDYIPTAWDEHTVLGRLFSRMNWESHIRRLWNRHTGEYIIRVTGPQHEFIGDSDPMTEDESIKAYNEIMLEIDPRSTYIVDPNGDFFSELDEDEDDFMSGLDQDDDFFAELEAQESDDFMEGLEEDDFFDDL